MAVVGQHEGPCDGNVLYLDSQYQYPGCDTVL